MKNVKIITIIITIILITLVAFGGVYIKTQNRMENKVKEYSLGRELEGERVVNLKVSSSDDEGENNSEAQTVENYKTVKNTIEKRLKSLKAEDYTISLNEEDGTIKVELPENDRTDDYVYYLITSGKVQIKEKDASTELLNENMIKKAQYTYSNNTDGAYQVYLEIFLTKDGQTKIEEIQKDYAVLATEIDEIEAAQKSDENTDSTENTEETTSETNTENTEETANDENVETENTKKIATLTVAGTEYDIEKIEKNKIQVKIGSQTSNNTSVNNNMAKAAELTMLINSGKCPVEYKVENNRFVHSEITNKQLLYFTAVIAVIILAIFVLLIIKYKTKGLLVDISCVGFIALLSLVLRYTNVIISIEGIGAIILVILINLQLNKTILNKIKTINLVNEAVTSSYKETFLRLVPVMIISLVFCFSGWTNLSSFGMIMFWGFILIAAYNIIVTKTLLKLRENK